MVPEVERCSRSHFLCMYQTLGDEPPRFLVSISAVLVSAVFFVSDTWSVIRRDKHRPHVSCSW